MATPTTTPRRVQPHRQCRDHPRSTAAIPKSARTRYERAFNQWLESAPEGLQSSSSTEWEEGGTASYKLTISLTHTPEQEQTKTVHWDARDPLMREAAFYYLIVYASIVAGANILPNDE
jgi:hypothetical protein